MPPNRFNAFTDLGVGLGLRGIHYDYIIENQPQALWFEIISENYFREFGRHHATLEAIKANYTVIQHGVALYPGNADGLNHDHLRELKSLMKRTNTPYISDHLCWGSNAGRYSHDLLPLPYTLEIARKVGENVRIAQDFLEVPICVENVSSYLTYDYSTLTEWEFLSEVAEVADCGILLDVNNIYVSSYNHKFDPFSYLRGIPLERVGQLHIAGHKNYGSHIIDTHSTLPIGPVWELYQEVIRLLGRVNTLLEWDSEIPEFTELVSIKEYAESFYP
jgi:hypothetical protein